jgi:hypothetical protein
VPHKAFKVGGKEASKENTSLNNVMHVKIHRNP